MFEDIARGFKEADFEGAFEFAIHSIAPDIEKANRAQLWSGIDSTGDKTGPPYEPQTIQIKSSLGQPTDRVTLYDTGAFHKSIYVDVVDDGLIIGATDKKAKELEDKYTIDIYGLTENSMSHQLERLRSLVIEVFFNDLDF